MKAITKTVITTAISIVLLTGLIGPLYAESELTGLRQGRVFIKTQTSDDYLYIEYKPAYGWDDPLLLYGPDGRLVLREFLGHDKSGKLTLNLNSGPGVYELILKPSYSWKIETSADYMVYQPLVEQSSLYERFDSGQKLYFKVPENTNRFGLFWINYRSFSGLAARLRLYSPDNAIFKEQSRQRIVKSQVLKRMMGMESGKIKSGSLGTDIVVRDHPLPPSRIEVENPTSGMWSVELGTKGSLMSDDTGLWLAGVPSYFSEKPQAWFNPEQLKGEVKVKVEITNDELAKPFLGIVGQRGNPGSRRDQLLKSFGMSGQKIFFRQSSQEPVNDNQNPDDTRFDAFKFDGHGSLMNRDDDIYSLVVFRWWADWLNFADNDKRNREFSEWVYAAANNLLNVRKLNPERFSIQIFNEPNLESSVSEDDYLNILKLSGKKIRSDPLTKPCRIAGPGSGSGQENGFIDFKLLKRVLMEADEYIDVITFNPYKARELEDTFIYADTIYEVADIINEFDTDGQTEDIIIGATNRMGGFAPNHLFDGKSASLWWASVLCQVVNTGLVKGIYHYSLIDKGIRKKGMFNELLQPKPQLYVHKTFAKLISSGKLYRTETDHDGLEGVYVDQAKEGTLFLVNKSKIDMKVNISRYNRQLQIKSVSQLLLNGLLRPLGETANPEINVPAESIILLIIRQKNE